MNRIFLKKINFSSGFTLLELMVSIAIISILAVVSFNILASLRENSALKNSQSKVKAVIKKAQNYSLQGIIPNGGYSGTLCGYGFKFINTTQYEIFYYTDTVNGAGACQIGNTTISETLMEQYNLKKAVVLNSPIPGDAKIYFGIPNADVTFSPIASSLILDFKNGIQEKKITINTGGLITNN